MRRTNKNKSDWTYEFFVKNPKIFLGAFNVRIARAKKEVKTVLKYLNKQGFKPDRILDLNCGVGRHSVEFGKLGLDVIGTDLSPHYVSIAKKEARKAKVINKVKLRVADMRRITAILKNEKPLDGIVNLWTSFGYFDDKTNDKILRECLKLVHKGGFFAIEIISKDWILKNFRESSFSKAENMIILQNHRVSPKNSRIYNTWTYLEKKGKETYVFRKEINLNHRVWNLGELVKMFKKAGWKFKAAYPGFETEGKDIPVKEARRFLVIFSK